MSRPGHPPWEDDKTYPALLGGKVVEVSGADIKRGLPMPTDLHLLTERVTALESQVEKLSVIVKQLGAIAKVTSDNVKALTSLAAGPACIR